MNARLRKLLEQRATAWSAVQDIQARRATAGYDPTAEDGEAFTRSLDDVERLSAEIETEERAARIGLVLDAVPADQRSTNPVGGDLGAPNVSEQYRGVFDEYMRRGNANLDGEKRQLLQSGFEEIRAGGTATGAAGGFTVPPEFLNRLTEVRKAFGGVAGLAETITTTTGAPLPWPTNNDTSNVGAILTENSAVTEQDVVFGQGSIGAFMYTSKLVRLSIQLLQDTGFNLETWLSGKLGERIGRASAAHFASGVGTTEPQGLSTGLTLGLTTAAVNAIGYDDLVDLEHSIDPAYRGPNAGYVLHDSVLRGMRKIKDTTGRPLWVPAIAAGAPSTINGQKYTVDNGLATMALGSKSVVFGDIKAAYLVREVRGAQVLRLAERYAEFLQVGFLGFTRLDGKVQDTQAAAVLTTKAA